MIEALLSWTLAAAEGGLSARELVERAHEAAGGEVWRRPRTLLLEGQALLHDPAGERPPLRADRYRMWRVFPDFQDRAHAASGKVRIEAFAGERLLFRIAYDGRHTWNQDGRVPERDADRQWSEAFGFGILRFALEEGFRLRRLADDLVDGHPCGVVRVDDPAGEQTLFWIDLRDFSIRKVGFRTPRGWHERVYGDFFRVDPPGWQQPGRVRLYDDGVLTNDIRWHTARVNLALPDELFAPPFPDAP
ncbi:MAG: hypothetical protein RML12_10965 [Xanthomonadales bacterium]|nr:hypothetical protein [Xanthomonadales bacterium]